MNPEPESPITLALVDRISERLALGIPLRIALAGEPVKIEDYEQHMTEHPELREREDLAKRKYLEHALDVILRGKDPAANFRWHLELVYPNVIGKKCETEKEEEEKQTIRGIPEYLLEQARADLHRRTAENDWEYPEGSSG